MRLLQSILARLHQTKQPQHKFLTQALMSRAMIGHTTSAAGGEPCENRRRAAAKRQCYAAQRSESMARVPYVARDELDAEGQEIYDRIRRDRNAPEVGLQFRALLHSPKATGYLTSLGAQLRFQRLPGWRGG